VTFSELEGCGCGSLACITYLNCPDRAPVQVYGGGRLIGMRFVSVPMVHTTLRVMVSCIEIPPLYQLRECSTTLRHENNDSERAKMTCWGQRHTQTLRIDMHLRNREDLSMSGMCFGMHPDL
jgi:hypothetical protein